ncbi:DNA-processing protein DprA [Microbulbifer thermotolerans]|uniref:DNA processing protein DprA n=1 Tax=Microbulbifer thermotolerans TaxID=252514 RepID=A0A143HI64_MICTH|nr:DNA-processing protein DprA [Microbulbifer thermotolerans]AMX01197.1 DNA processing protein DprA [Microbulbifer thermotolerans]MCX2778488.1 DNA-processing protein DprA [Microbulbifer thermotolerans]MCX2782976.1 DNA-processing protein DprA [Microbulbifer thermotolerans]MCX2793972.1 DNA-processing protein DprA [Microbulbifer thermotolerans]MCX2804003.1 DNA-processing protein DprA [Microbulbifer thermotolerans]
MDALTATLALLRLEGLGPGRYWQLIEHFGDPVGALQSLSEFPPNRFPERVQGQWRELARLGEHSAQVAWAYAEQERCAAAGVRLLSHSEDDYPRLLAEISRPPPLLYVRGAVEALQLPQIAVVGARRASRSGLDNARAFATELAGSGFAVTSGLALGVDAAAHLGALKAGGVTLAVLGSGVDRLYPRRNQPLAEDIVAGGGAIVSEQPMGSAPEASNFPRRNRIIAGLSLGVLVVEAALRSGSLITAQLALEQNREVFAIPGSIHNPLARGCHKLIKEGAALVETSMDIVQQLGGLLAQPPADAHEPGGGILETRQRRLVEALGGDLRTLEQLARDTGEDTGPLMAQLLELELAGIVEQLPGGYQLTPAGAAHLQETID